uniref:Uncharacterized protein n=1 Tax=Rhipicephalus microplus TaxID=6941 RepID=A0A6G5A3H3_RHIMP
MLIVCFISSTFLNDTWTTWTSVTVVVIFAETPCPCVSSAPLHLTTATVFTTIAAHTLLVNFVSSAGLTVNCEMRSIHTFSLSFSVTHVALRHLDRTKRGGQREVRRHRRCTIKSAIHRNT